MKTIKQHLKKLIFFIPLLIGLYGFYFIEQEPFLDSLYNSILLYLFNYNVHPANIWIELARWTAPCMTFSGVILIFNQFKESFRQFAVRFTGKSTAVYGNDAICEVFLNELKPYAFKMTDSFVRASRYMLLDTEENNFSLYQKYQNEFKHCPVYIKCSSLPSQSVCSQNLHLFCAEEIAARLYWKSNFLYPVSKEKNHQLNIVLIGWNKLAEEVLLSSLQNNIFSPKQKYSYQIFGDGEAFLAKHTALSDLSDTIEFISNPWYLQIDKIEQADIVLICTQESQLTLVNDLLFSTTRKEFHVLAARKNELQLLSDAHRLKLFDWKQESIQSEYIFKDTLYRRAKKINVRYAHLYSDVPETKEQMEMEWNRLDAFTRGSNISSADYHEVRLRMLKEDNLSEDVFFESDQFELHSELEHIRWCRYHTLNNWTYGIPDSGKNKDAAMRIHKLLIPYQNLSEIDKEKDRENIKILHSIQ